MTTDFERFLNRLRILRSIDKHEIPLASWKTWWEFQDNPYEYLIRCQPDEAEQIWAALRKRDTA